MYLSGSRIFWINFSILTINFLWHLKPHFKILFLIFWCFLISIEGDSYSSEFAYKALDLLRSSASCLSCNLISILNCSFLFSMICCMGSAPSSCSIYSAAWLSSFTVIFIDLLRTDTCSLVNWVPDFLLALSCFERFFLITAWVFISTFFNSVFFNKAEPSFSCNLLGVFSCPAFISSWFVIMDLELELLGWVRSLNYGFMCSWEGMFFSDWFGKLIIAICLGSSILLLYLF